MAHTTLPHWDLRNYYTALDSAAFIADFDAAIAAIAELTTRFDQYAIGKRDPSPISATDLQAYEEITIAVGDLNERIKTLRAYIYSFVSTNSRDQEAQARLSALQQQLVAFDQLATRFTAWLGGTDIAGLIAQSALAAEHRYMVERAQIEASHLMSPEEEALAAELGPSGGGAWNRLQADVSSQLVVNVPFAEGSEELPMARLRNVAFESDRERRRVAYEAELAAWKRNEVPIAAAMNGIKGEVSVLARRRKWEAPLAEALFDNAIDQATLDAMLAAAHESFPDFRRYFRAKARMLGLKQLAWYDLFAPIGQTVGNEWEYERACEFIIVQFERFAPHMAALAGRAFDEGWIDAEPRAGKVGGAFCMGVRGADSRILMNYTPSVNSVMTLAHELGHAYHNLCLANQSPLLRTSPMTLAETASIFCETIVRKAAIAAATPAERLVILEAALQNSSQVVVDITSRFLFEQAVFAGRSQRALSAEELCEAMLQAQRDTYGDGLEASALHAYMWAAKPHYYSAGRSFYNYPYMFGLLFGLGLYAISLREPDGFVERYDALLASTGQADAATLAARVGIDIRTPAFWRASLDMVREDIAAFEALV
jgi:oligoendopeptidase F